MIEKLLEICLTSTNRSEFQAHTRNLDRASVSRLVNTVYTNSTSIREKSKLESASCLLLASRADNFDLVRHLVEDCDANTELLVSLTAHELWDALTFAKQELDCYSFLNDNFQAVHNIKATVAWHLCRVAYEYNAATDIFKYLVSKGANVNSSAEATFNSTPLM
jgi:hypothetical protein